LRGGTEDCLLLANVAQTKHEIQSILAELETHPRYRFGQNFMIDQNLVRLIAEAGEISPGDLVIEVGPGTGTLTEELLTRGAHVVAVEIDRQLAEGLRNRFGSAGPHPNPPPEYQGRESTSGGSAKLELIEGDALAGKHELNPQLLAAMQPFDPAHRKLVANLPYNIASPLIIELLIAGTQRLAFTVQREVADRLKATADSDAYGPLSVVVQMLADVKILRTIPPQAFWPAPKIDSALVAIDRRNQLGEQANPFSRFVHKLFSARRKTLRKALMQAEYPADDLIAGMHLNPTARPETLDPPTLHRLFLAAQVVPPPQEP
jgi:16S rRNA (adenine1518-N6/adenine1519-N6)-dimethyltransferase